MKEEILLGTRSYFVSAKNKTVWFEESRPMGWQGTRFSLDRIPVFTDGNFTPGTWVLDVDLDRWNGIPVSHIKDAIDYCEKHFGKNFDPYPEGF